MRTDQTFLCPSCALRFSPAGSCPSCGSDRLSDLSDAKSRKLALEAMRSHGPGAKRAERLGRVIDRLARSRNTNLVVLPLLVAAVVALAVGHGLHALEVFFFVLIAGAVVVAIGHTALQVWLEVERERLLAAGARPVRIHPLQAPRLGAVRTTFRGRVRATSTVTSPVSRRPCVAYRLVGETAGGMIDDAVAVAFEVVAEGNSAWVETAAAAFDLEVSSPCPVRVGLPLVELLRSRGILRVPQGLSLAEVLLCEGDEVIIEGTAEEGAGAKSVYRGPALRFKDVEGSPLIVRRTEPAAARRS